MTHLIKDLLTLADMENLPASRLVECSLSDIVEMCCSDVLRVYPDALVSISKPDKEISLIGDPSLLEMAFMNLLDNAAKYSPKPAQILVVLEEIDESVRLAVSDQGMGIPASDLEHIFERFYTVDKAHSRKLGGSGLGLSIVQTIIEKHGGKITVASELGKGTTFTILLPKKYKHFDSHQTVA
jgi:two-component system phosphate regulon sensor histidine kinase PhoR